jgi:DNA-3-methyladenine glycosylase II
MMGDTEIIDQLVKIKGVGLWTAEMFLIFSLGREDVFSMGDLGLTRAMEKLYCGGRKSLGKPKKLRITQKWSPYRSYACLILWRSLDNTPLP